MTDSRAEYAARPRLACAASLVLAAVAHDAGADDTERVTLLPDTVVSASAVPVSGEAVGSATTVITREQLDRRQTVVVSDALREVPGVSVNRAGPMGALTNVRIRGAETRHTLVLIDGVEANDSFASGFDFGHLLADDVERVEVLRGPQSALYGSDAVGGVVNVVTRGGERGFEAAGKFEAGTFSTTHSSASLRGGGERWSLSGSASVLDSEGYNMSRFAGDRDGYTNRTLRLKGDVEPMQNLRLSASFNGTDNDVDNDFSQVVGPLTGFTVSSADTTESSEYYGRGEARLTLLDGAWEQVVGGSYTSLDNDVVSAFFGDSGFSVKKRKVDYQSNVFFDTAGMGGVEHGLSLRAEHERESFVNDAPGAAAQDQKRAITVNSLAGEYRASVAERLDLSASARHDNNSRFKDANTWRITGSLRVARTASRLHASAGKAIKNPSFTDLFGFFPGFFTGNPTLKPETSKGFDVGVEQTLFDGRLIADLTYFRATLHDEINGFAAVGPIFTALNRVGASRREGFELSARARLSDSLSATGGYTYLRADEPAPGRLEEVRRPKHEASVSLDWRSADRRSNVHIGLFHHGKVQDVFFPAAGPRRVVLPSYTLVNIAMDHEIADGFTFAARIENLLDQSYEEQFSVRAPRLAAFAGLRVRLDELF
jgi:vitamin B12 transporter